ncbi:MAG: SIMPL domain-containing protein [Betaproteobacteria bacterium]|nr:SIMPL domain-containing protein [Betaproteobacteria bacterium]
MRFINWLCLVASLSFAAAAPAAEPAQFRYNTVEFQAEVLREVPNDLLNATLYVEWNDANPAAVANAVNKSVNDALRVARDYKSVRARSGNNQTYPVYSRANELQGWRGRAEIRIESRDFEAAAGLIARLQSGMRLGNLSFSVSPETRRAVESELITEAIAAFKARAEIVQAALAGRGYKLQRLNVASGHHAPQPRLAMARATAPAQEVTAPNLEAGVSQITVTASGAIEVIER